MPKQWRPRNPAVVCVGGGVLSDGTANFPRLVLFDSDLPAAVRLLYGATYDAVISRVRDEDAEVIGENLGLAPAAVKAAIDTLVSAGLFEKGEDGEPSYWPITDGIRYGVPQTPEALDALLEEMEKESGKKRRR